MKHVVLIFVVILLHSASAEIDNNKLLQIFADVSEDDIISESCQQALSLLVENLTNFDDPWPLRSNYNCFTPTNIYLLREEKISHDFFSQLFSKFSTYEKI